MKYIFSCLYCEGTTSRDWNRPRAVGTTTTTGKIYNSLGAHIADGEAAVWDGHVQASFLPDEDGVGEALLLYVLQAQLQDKQLQNKYC